MLNICLAIEWKGVKLMKQQFQSCFIVFTLTFLHINIIPIKSIFRSVTQVNNYLYTNTAAQFIKLSNFCNLNTSIKSFWEYVYINMEHVKSLAKASNFVVPRTFVSFGRQSTRQVFMFATLQLFYIYFRPFEISSLLRKLIY